MRPDITAKAEATPLSLVMRQLPALALGAGILWMCLDRLADIDVTAIGAAMLHVSAWQWAGALALAALSFWAVGRYDALVHRHMATGRSGSEAARAGLLAIAIGQSVGFGVLIGTLVRHRMLPGLGFVAALRLTLAVSGLFLVGWAIVTTVAFAILPGPFAYRLAAIAVLLILPILFWAALIHPEIRLFSYRIQLPTLETLLRLVALAAIDTVAAGLCLAIVLPADAGVTVFALLPAFLLALGLGMITGTPGGVGLFEVIMLSLLPHAAPEALLAGILAWRVVYFILPMSVAFVFLALGPRKPTRTASPPKQMVAGFPLPSWIEAMLRHAKRAEAGILRQGDKVFLAIEGGGVVMARTGQSLVMIGDRLGDISCQTALARVTRAANHEARQPCLYKAGAKQAAHARQAGWKVAPIACEAWLKPCGFDLTQPQFRQLRRKLRKVDKAGVQIQPANTELPLQDMDDISKAWVKKRGQERGLSMGRFCPEYIRAQRVYLAYKNDVLVGFLTLHVSSYERTIDLMRARPDAPDGTMHALLHHAIQGAALENCPRLSLAAVPHKKLTTLAAHLPRKIVPQPPSGLLQFKNAFAPKWEVLYIAAPSWFALMVSGLDLARGIHAPGTKTNQDKQGAKNCNQVKQQSFSAPAS